MFYAGAKLHPTRRRTRESIGYAYSRDGVRFIKFGRNPVAPYHATPHATSYSEPCALFDMPFIYVYHTLRYREPWLRAHRRDPLTVEDIGVQVLATQTPFHMFVPLLADEGIDPSRSVSLERVRALNLSQVSAVALTAACTYGRRAAHPAHLLVQSSPDGTRFDTRPLARWALPLVPGTTVRQTFDLAPSVRFIRVLVENPDPMEALRDVQLTATLSG